MAVSPKEGGKFVTALERNLLAIATGKKPAPADPTEAVRTHVAALQRMGASVRG